MAGKILWFVTRGERFEVNARGYIKRLDIPGFQFSPTWRFLGVSKHHWSNHPTVSLAEAFKNPQSLVGGLVWDVDHGTTRVWGGSYAGRLPRVTAAGVRKASGIRPNPPWSRQHFELVARVLREVRAEATAGGAGAPVMHCLDRITDRFTVELGRKHPQFSEHRFKKAAGKYD